MDSALSQNSQLFDIVGKVPEQMMCSKGKDSSTLGANTWELSALCGINQPSPK